ncbi:MAG: uracil-DNA glycosylase [Actinobacteria bacterium]|nr:uracil-DNA glycosylase [Actinomycetota bacterium]
MGETRVELVFGAGDTAADIMFVGEAPGRAEDLSGEPFVGAAGKLLDELLASVDLDRRQVYIANILKCRPPGNRDPLPAEVELCAGFLREQVRLVHPRVLVTLGNHATRFILGTQAGITELRGKPMVLGEATVFPVFHPAAVIYDRSKREVLFEDFRAIAALSCDSSGLPAEEAH